MNRFKKLMDEMRKLHSQGESGDLVLKDIEIVTDEASAKDKSKSWMCHLPYSSEPERVGETWK